MFRQVEIKTNQNKRALAGPQKETERKPDPKRIRRSDEVQKQKASHSDKAQDASEVGGPLDAQDAGGQSDENLGSWISARRQHPRPWFYGVDHLDGSTIDMSSLDMLRSVYQIHGVLLFYIIPSVLL